MAAPQAWPLLARSRHWFLGNGEKLDYLSLDLWQFDENGKTVRCDAYYKSQGYLFGDQADW